MGRPVQHYFDCLAAADTFDYYAENGYDALGTSSLNTPGHVAMSFKQPVGVVAAIIPWNVPLVFFASKAAAALAAGCTVVVKSSEKAPLTVSLPYLSIPIPSLPLSSLEHTIPRLPQIKTRYIVKNRYQN